MIKVRINNENYSIATDGVISTMDKKAINTNEWRAKSLIIECETGFKTLTLDEADQAVSKKAYLRSEEHGQPKLVEINVVEIIK